MPRQNVPLGPKGGGRMQPRKKQARDELAALAVGLKAGRTFPVWRCPPPPSRQHGEKVLALETGGHRRRCQSDPRKTTRTRLLTLVFHELPACINLPQQAAGPKSPNPISFVFSLLYGTAVFLRGRTSPNARPPLGAFWIAESSQVLCAACMC